MSEITKQTESPQFPAILPVIEDYLEKQKAAGEPMRIHFWDTNHHIADPAQVAADKSLHDLIKQYGSPLYVIEAADKSVQDRIISDAMTKQKETGKSIELSIKPEYAKNLPRKVAMIKMADYKLYDSFEQSDNPTDVLYPDSREKELGSKLSTEEINLLERYNKFLQSELKNKGLTESIENIINNAEEINSNFAKTLSKKEHETFSQASKKYYNTVYGDEQLNTSVVDERISENINKVFDPKKHVQVTLYGLLHFSKELDLNERMPGLSIAIARSDKLEVVRESFLTKPFSKIHNQFPDYVYYTDQDRMVKMNNDKAKAEFLGISESDFKIHQIKQQMEKDLDLPSIKLPYTDEIAIAPPTSLPHNLTGHNSPSHNMA
ncbi:MAG: hypothetical protein R3D71_03935 [Rickettsiales bacterium]